MLIWGTFQKDDVVIFCKNIVGTFRKYQNLFAAKYSVSCNKYVEWNILCCNVLPYWLTTWAPVRSDPRFSSSLARWVRAFAGSILATHTMHIYSVHAHSTREVFGGGAPHARRAMRHRLVLFPI